MPTPTVNSFIHTRPVEERAILSLLVLLGDPLGKTRLLEHIRRATRTAADYVIHMDPWGNPAVEDQASDRAHRMGQQHPVTIYRLVARHTIEEAIVDLHRHKRELAHSLLDGGDASARMSSEEIMRLLQAEMQ